MKRGKFRILHEILKKKNIDISIIRKMLITLIIHNNNADKIINRLKKKKNLKNW